MLSSNEASVCKILQEKEREAVHNKGLPHVQNTKVSFGNIFLGGGVGVFVCFGGQKPMERLKSYFKHNVPPVHGKNIVNICWELAPQMVKHFCEMNIGCVSILQHSYMESNLSECYLLESPNSRRRVNWSEKNEI